MKIPPHRAPRHTRTRPLVCISSPLDFVTYAEIYDNIIQDCGMEDYIFSGDGENGEGICEKDDCDVSRSNGSEVSTRGVRNVYYKVASLGLRTFLEIHIYAPS